MLGGIFDKNNIKEKIETFNTKIMTHWVLAHILDMGLKPAVGMLPAFLFFDST